MKPAALAAALAMLPLVASAGCLDYDKPVELRGTLRRHTFAEQPNYESIAKGDRPATYFFIALKPPVCVNEGAEKDLEPAVAGVKTVQLVFDSVKSYDQLRPYLGKRVVCSGKLFSRISGHHHSPVLLDVSVCRPLETPVSPSQLKAEIQASGARAVLHKYYDAPAWSASIMPGIRSAAPAWLEVGEQLDSVADAGASEDLALAFYDALAVAPFRVIALLVRTSGGSVEQICNVSFEDEVPRQGVTAYLNEIRRKLGAPKTSEQKVMAAACMRGLDQSQATAAEQGLR